jgi:hypothetical protein
VAIPLVPRPIWAGGGRPSSGKGEVGREEPKRGGWGVRTSRLALCKEAAGRRLRGEGNDWGAVIP